MLFLFPLLVTLTLLYGMLGWTLVVSFSDWQGVKPNYDFAGFKWYEMMLTHPRF